MSDHEDTSMNSGYSTPVPELDDHTRNASYARRGTTESMQRAVTQNQIPALDHLDQELFPIIARDFEHAVDEDENGMSPRQLRQAPPRSRRGTANTLEIRDISPPSSVKAFADARRRERQMSVDASFSGNELHRTATNGSGRSRRSRRYTEDHDAASNAGSSKTAEEDICFPLYPTGIKDGLNINFSILDEFIADEENRDRTPPQGQPQPRVFCDLRADNQAPSDTTTVFTSDGDVIQVPSSEAFDLKEKPTITDSQDELVKEPERIENRFEFFSSNAESTIHAAEIGDLVLPGEDISQLFQLPRGEDMDDGVWWLNMNNPTEEEIRVICKAFGIHPLTIEDIGTQEAREKIELFPSYYFACFRSFSVVEDDDQEGGQDYEPFNIYVVVFREGTLSFSFAPNSHAAHVRKRITMLKDYVALSSDWICYALIDDIVDGFAPVIAKIEHATDVIEDSVFATRDSDMHKFLRTIGKVRKNVMGLMKLLGGKADVLRGFTKRCNENYKVTPRMDIGLYLGDIQDHVVTMMTSLAHFEKMLSRSHSNYLAQLSIDNITQGNRANQVLSKITLLASVLVPLNLVCGMFGMNVSVPWKNTDSLIPFFSILAFLVVFSAVVLAICRRLKFI